MNPITLILLLIKYGPAIYEIVKEIVGLIKWFRNRPAGNLGIMSVDADHMQQVLEAELDRFKRTPRRKRSNERLIALREQLRRRRRDCEGCKD